MPELRLDGTRYHDSYQRHRRSRRWLACAALLVALGVVTAAVVLVASGTRGKTQGKPATSASAAGHGRRPSPPQGKASLAPTTAATRTTTTLTLSTTVTPAPPLPKQIGQLLIGSFAGTVPPESLLIRIRTGQLGGVILYSNNTAAGLGATRTMDAEMQRAAKKGGNPPLLIMTDQEGGQVRRLPGAPTMNADQITSTVEARQEGVATGRLLRSVGVNLDLAPVSDVEAPTGSFLGPRSFGTDPSSVGALACAFAAGLASTGVGYTLKHFPGLGLATTSTDVAPVTISASAAALEADWDAYRRCGSDPRALIMVSNAIYPSLTGSLPAVESALTYSKALPAAVGHHEPLTISDDLGAGALTNQPSPALHAFGAGLDMALYASTTGGSDLAYPKLLADVRVGLLPRGRILSAEKAVVAFKKVVAG